MIWFTLFLFVASFFLSVLLTPKPEIENARPGKLGDIRFPRANEGSPVPVIYGRVRLFSPNVIWYGDFRSSANTKKVKTGLFSKKRVITSHNYFVGFDLSLCTGPGVKLKKIWVEKKILFITGVGIGDGGAATFNKGNIFGGKERGGGMVGTGRFYSGEFNTTQNAYLQGRLGTDIPAYVGNSHIVFERIYIGTSPNLRPLSFEVERYPDNLGLIAAIGDNKVGNDLNPMEILFSALTEEWGGVGVDPTEIDTASFIAVATTLQTEVHGMSLSVQSTNSAKSIVEEVLRQVDGLLYQDPVTGKLVVRLIREDYVVGDLPVFNEKNIDSITNFSRTAWGETSNQVRINFTYRNKNYETGAAIVQDMANINFQNRIKSTTISFPGITQGPLAIQVCTRELSQLSVPLFHVTVNANRQAAQLRPGDPFVLDWPDYNLSQIVLRVQRFDIGELAQGRVVMECLQDKFSASNALYGSPEDTLWDEVDKTPVDITQFQVFESPYWFLNRIDITELTIEVDSAYLWALARKPPLMIRYDFVVSNDNFVLETTVELNYIPFTSSAELKTAVFKQQGQKNGNLTKIVIQNLDPEQEGFFQSFLNDNVTPNDIRDEGINLFCINGEIFAYEGFTDLGAGEFELNTVRRALLDTQYEDHAALDIVFFIDSIDGLSLNTRPNVGTLWFKFLSFSDQDAQEIGDVTSTTTVQTQRYDRPLPPDSITTEAVRTPIEIVEVTDIDITTWDERNRVTPDQVVLVGDSSDTPESVTTYNARFLLDGVQQVQVSAIASPPPFPINLTGLSGAGIGRIEVESILSSLTSHTVDFVEFFFNSYANLGTELFSNGDFEGVFPGAWTVVSGSWDDVITAYPLDPIITVGAVTDNEHAEALAINSELRQDHTIGADSQKQAIVRAYKGGLVAGATGQLIVELRDATTALDTITTPLEAVANVGTWELIEIPLPLRNDATIVRVRLVGTNIGSVWDNISLKVNSVTRTAATVQYDDIASPVGAWGLRKMISTYSGPLCRIRDTFDNTEFDVNADPDGNLEPFFVKGEAAVVRLHDQSGNAAHLEAESQSEQPRLRWLQSETGRPHIEWDGTAEALIDTVAATNRPYMVTEPNMMLAIGPKKDTTNDYIATIPHQDGTHTSPDFLRCGLTTGATDWRIGLNGPTLAPDPGNGPSDSGKNVWFLDYKNGEAYHNDDVTSVQSWTAANVTYPLATRLRIAETGAGTLEWTGNFYELCIFPFSLNAANRKTMMEQVADYWYNLAV